MSKGLTDMIYSFNGYEFEICKAPTPRKGWWVIVTVDHAKSGHTFDTKEQAQEFILSHADTLIHPPTDYKYKRGGH